MGHRSLVRIAHKADGKFRPNGMGFLVADGHIMTCAHVLSGILKKARVADADTIFSFNFWVQFTALDDSDDAWIAAHVVRNGWYPSDRKESDGLFDIAVLELAPAAGQKLPEDVRPVRFLGELPAAAAAVAAYGIDPSTMDHPKWIFGKLAGTITSSYRQFDPNRGEAFVEKGFSGGALWDEAQQCALGMIVEKTRRPGLDDGVDTRRGLFFDYGTLRSAWSGIGDPVDGAAADASDDPFADHLFRFVNRETQVSEFNSAATDLGDADWPIMIFVLQGVKKDEHGLIADRLAATELARIVKDDVIGAAEPMGTLASRLPPEQEFGAIKVKIAQRIESADATPKSVADKLNENYGQKTFLYEVSEKRLNPDSEKIVSLWAEFIKDVIDAGLRRPIVVFLAIVTTERPDPDHAVAQRIVQLLNEKLPPGIVVDEVPPLDEIFKDDAEWWFANYVEKYAKLKRSRNKHVELEISRMFVAEDEYAMFDFRDRLAPLIYDMNEDD